MRGNLNSEAVSPKGNENRRYDIKDEEQDGNDERKTIFEEEMTMGTINSILMEDTEKETPQEGKDKRMTQRFEKGAEKIAARRGVVQMQQTRLKGRKETIFDSSVESTKKKIRKRVDQQSN